MIGRKHDGGDWVKVVDFGIAKTIEAEMGQNVTTAGVSLGTPEYMSPEQFAGEKLDHRTDIYSLGLVLFNMLTGQLPYPRVTSKETLVKRLTTQPAALAEVRPTTPWPPGLQTALDRALAPDAAERYPRVLDFATDVVRASERPPVIVNRVQTTAPTPVSIPVQEEAPAKRPEPPKRQPVWPIFAWLVLIALIGGGFFYRRQIKQTLGLLPPPVSDTVAVVTPAAAPDSLLQVTVTPQGEAQDSSAAANSHGGQPTTKQGDKPNGDKPALPTAPANSVSVSAVTSPTTQSSPPTRSDSISSTTHNLLPHPWLRATGDSGATRAADEGVAPEVLQRMRLEEVQGHLALTRRYAARGDVAHARAAYRDASVEARGLELADPSMRARLNLLLSIGQREAMQACQSAHADTLNPFAAQVDCGALFAW